MAQFASGSTNYPELDATGSVTSLTSSSGVLVNTYTYDSFGNAMSSSGSIANAFRFTGRELDSETGAMFYRARYYDPNSGRFIGEDPIAFNGGANFYAYAANNPTNLIDSFGLRPGDKYPNVRCAGWHAIRDINQTSRRRTPAFPNGREYGGWVYENADGTYSYVVPVAGAAASVDPRNYTPNPANTTRAADYHTHGAYDPAFNGPGNPAPGSPGYVWGSDNNEVFSPSDKQTNDRWGLPGFLGTPRGTTEEYIPNPMNPGHGPVVVLDRGACGCR
jgi:RHS repeat-associated protein